jgi:hypothetical protein
MQGGTGAKNGSKKYDTFPPETSSSSSRELKSALNFPTAKNVIYTDIFLFLRNRT